ncbi:hypothetical protein [Capnocytophaga sp.]|uniref:hypothetical protein n=1 Tax=Capnocytophaga sp. TaxID=44737 RepID=UPI0026DB6840|nr:hypothetical protein [Capnocytophaga sp.]MDO5106329.1 hypothetical protein [Capnocytophaga sp.]
MTTDNPLAYFEKLFTKNQEILKQEFIEDFPKDLYKAFYVDIDEDKCRITCSITDSEMVKIEEEIYDFETTFKQKVYDECLKCKEIVDADILDITHKGVNPQYYKEELVGKLKKFLLKAKRNFKDYPFLELYIQSFISYLIPNTSDMSLNSSVYDSFIWILGKGNEKLRKIKKLHRLLVEKSFIEADEQEFINAFTGKEITQGICWLLKSKNKGISKASVFDFIEQLEQKEYIQNIDPFDFGRKIEYVFRKNDAAPFENIKQSLSQFRNKFKTSDYHREIETIISEI